MKKIILFYTIFSCFYIFSQNDTEKQKIKQEYNKVDSNKILDYFYQEEFLRTQRVLNYFSQFNNINKKQKYYYEGVLYEAFDVIDNNIVYISTDNASSARAIKVNHLYTGGSLGLSLSGQGMTVGVWDGGWALGTHNEFMTSGSSKISFPDAGVSNPVSDFHATHVAGTVAAKGFTSSAKGMAPSANLLSYDWTNDGSEVIYEAFNNALLISNHSYGVPVLTETGDLNVPSWYMGAYNSTARQWDLIAQSHPYYLPVMSAGNSGNSSYSGGIAPGYDKLTGNKNSKNSLIVANANPSINPITGNLTSLVINSSSSQGPTDDGRIKPDVAADGTNVISSSNSDNSSYATSSGTSMSSPSAAGSLLLLQEHFYNLFSHYMRAATLKSLVCHTAVDDSNSVGPDPIFGFGFLDIRESAQVVTNSSLSVPTSIVDELTLNQDQIYSFRVTVSSPKKLIATIGWTDPAGTSMDNELNSTTPVLVNDLDLRIIKDSEVNFPWKLQLSDVSAPALKGDNIVDNIEKVEVDNALGTYTIEVTHKGILDGSIQDYSLIVSGFDEIVLSNSTVVKNDIFIYPNPTNDFLNINSPNSFVNKYEIYDIQGRIVQEATTFEENFLQIDLKLFNSGVYLIKLFSENETFVKKFTKN